MGQYYGSLYGSDATCAVITIPLIVVNKRDGTRELKWMTCNRLYIAPELSQGTNSFGDTGEEENKSLAQRNQLFGQRYQWDIQNELFTEGQFLDAHLGVFTRRHTAKRNINMLTCAAVTRPCVSNFSNMIQISVRLCNVTLDNLNVEVVNYFAMNDTTLCKEFNTRRDMIGQVIIPRNKPQGTDLKARSGISLYCPRAQIEMVSQKTYCTG